MGNYRQRDVLKFQPTPSRPFPCYPFCVCSCSSHKNPKVKCVVHWFQMMYSGRLSMFADGPSSQYLPVTYDVARVSCPVAIVYGGRDYLGR